MNVEKGKVRYSEFKMGLTFIIEYKCSTLSRKTLSIRKTIMWHIIFFKEPWLCIASQGEHKYYCLTLRDQKIGCVILL